MPTPGRNVFPNNTFDAQNLQLAVRLHSALLRATGLEDRGVKPVAVHRRAAQTTLPGRIRSKAAICRIPHEARLIEIPEFRQKLAEAVASALR